MAEASPRPFRTEAEYREAEERVLHPETHARSAFFGEKKVALRPLPEKYARQLTKRVMAAMQKFQQAVAEGNPFDVDPICDALVDGCAILAQFYHLGIDRDWIEENMQDSEMHRVLEAQLLLQDQNSFLRNGALQLLRGLAATAKGLGEMTVPELPEELGAAHGGATPSSTSPSASPGESDSTSSSEPTREAS